MAWRLRLWRIHWKLYSLQQGAICVLQLADATVVTPFAKTWRHPQNRKYKTYSVITEEDRAIVNMYRKFRKVLSRAVFEVCEGTDTHTYKHTCRYTQWSVKDLRSGNSIFSAGPWLSARVGLPHPRGQGALDAECWCKWIFDAIFAFVFLDPYLCFINDHIRSTHRAYPVCTVSPKTFTSVSLCQFGRWRRAHTKVVTKTNTYFGRTQAFL